MNTTRKKRKRYIKVIFICKRKNSSITHKKAKIFSIHKDITKIKTRNGPEEFDEIIKFPNFNCTLFKNHKFNKIEFSKESLNNLNKNGYEDFNEFDFDGIVNIKINKKSNVFKEINCSECKNDETDFHQ